MILLQETIGSSDDAEMPTAEQMLNQMLRQVEEAVAAEQPGDDALGEAYLHRFHEYDYKLESWKSQLKAKIDQMERENGEKFTSDSYRTSVNFSRLSKPAQTEASVSSTQMQPAGPQTDDDASPPTASPQAIAFAALSLLEIDAMCAFITTSPHILQDRDIEGLLMMAYNKISAENDKEAAIRYVRRATALQYARDVPVWRLQRVFELLSVMGSPLRVHFDSDVQARMEQICALASEGPARMLQLQAEGLYAIRIPEEGSSDAHKRRQREMYETLSVNMKKALRTGSVDQINLVLAELEFAEAERILELLGQVHHPGPRNMTVC